MKSGSPLPRRERIKVRGKDHPHRDNLDSIGIAMTIDILSAVSLPDGRPMGYDV